MKTLFSVVLMFSGTLLAQTPFDGTWVAKMETVQLPKRAQAYLLQNGVYECSTCIPKIKVDADGKDHPIAGSPYFSAISIRVVDNNHLELTEKQRDKTVYSEMDTVSPDGTTLMQNITDSAGADGQPITAQKTSVRISAASEGSNPISGSWQAQKINVTSENGVTVTYRSVAHGLQASNPDGEGYTAKFDGKDYPIQGDPAHCTVSLKRVNANTMIETDKQAGRVHYQLRMVVSSDGKTMNVTETDKERGTTTTYTMQKKQG
jgi:hypothetical protein